MEASSDAELVARCRAGEQGAWDALVDRYARYVYAIAARVYRLEPSDAEDVFQDVFARVFERLDTLRDADALRPWIAQTTRRCAVDTLRRSGARRSWTRSPDGPDDGLARAGRGDDHPRRARRALADCREILDRFFTRDESYRTIGTELDLPAGTIASRIARCLARLRDVLQPDAVSRAGKKADRPRVG